MVFLLRHNSVHPVRLGWSVLFIHIDFGREKLRLQCTVPFIVGGMSEQLLLASWKT